MSVYIDSAYVDDVSQACSAFPIAGVTTNPSIVLAAVERGQRLDTAETLRRLLAITSGPVFAQPVGETAQALIEEGRRYRAFDSRRIVLKLPMTAVGVEAGLTHRREGTRIAFTAVTSLAQAYTAVLAGAEWVIPYFGRMRRAGLDACQQVSDMARLIASEGSSARLLAASVKTPADVVESVLAGADDVTAPPAVIWSMMEDPLSAAAVRQFNADFEKARALLEENDASSS